MGEFLISAHFKWNKTYCLYHAVAEKMGKNLCFKTKIPAVKYLVPVFNNIYNEDKWTDNLQHLQLFAELYRN